jgi:RNA polymerase sigma factor (sigma-70 family)
MTGDETAARRAAVADALYPEHAAAVLRALRAGVSYRTADGGRHVYRVESAFEAEDVCHEAMAVVLRQIGSGAFQIDRPVRPYLLRIAAHLALRRARRAHREVLFGDAAGDTLEAGSPPSADPAVAAERDALVRAFRDELAEPERAVLALTFEAGESQARAAEQLGLSRDQVYRTMTRIRAAAVRFFRERGLLDDP